MSMLVYIAEDDSEDYSILEEAINDLIPGITLRWSRNGADLLQNLFQDDVIIPDLIILDYNMPKLDGMQTLLKLNQRDHYRPVPKVFYTSGINLAYKEEALRAGASAFFLKGSSYSQVLHDVSNILSFGSVGNKSALF